MMTHETTSALIIDDDPACDATLRPLLEGAGYRVGVAQTPTEGLAILRACQQRMLVLFHVDLTDYTLSGLDGTSVLGALSLDPTLARHAYIVATESPDALSLALGKLLAKLAVRSIAKPFTAAEVRDALSRMGDHLAIERMPDGVPV